MMTLRERLGITDQQKSEFINRLIAFLKVMDQNGEIKDVPSHELASWWLRYVAKPAWIEERIATDMTFVAEVCESIEFCRKNLDMYEFMAEYAPARKVSKKIEPAVQASLIVAQAGSEEALAHFLSGIQEFRGVGWLGAMGMDRDALLDEVDRLLYPNGARDTLGDVEAKVAL